MNARQAVMLVVDVLVVVALAGFGVFIAAAGQAEFQPLAGDLAAYAVKAVAGLDVVAVLVLPMEQGVRAIVIGFVGHLEGAGGAGVVAEVTVLVVQLEEVEQVVVDLGFQLFGRELAGLEEVGQLGFGLFALLIAEHRHGEQAPKVGLRIFIVGVFNHGLPERTAHVTELGGKGRQPVACGFALTVMYATQGVIDGTAQAVVRFAIDERLDELTLQARDAVNAEVQVVGLELEHVLEEAA
ncbi:hypothetical protein [Halomonas sp. IOP_31]|uniref:hypothetical protein n=1 Tax=Halomonas sp. IOP_31 TaxID=2876584 RepID=UPI001E63BECE|nr:hypothetical protein [Halomonas sp. IOP_31]MCD6007244.1 hypothetical protein [Halomonas sp. IOP_31]